MFGLFESKPEDPFESATPEDQAESKKILAELQMLNKSTNAARVSGNIFSLKDQYDRLEREGMGL
jgi:hypothetical protein